MSVAQPVELEIDFRRYANPPRRPEDFISFWNSFVPHLVGKPLKAGASHALEHPRDGVLSIRVISLPQNPIVGPDSVFAIHSILEPPRIRNFCARCKALGKQARGIYACIVCEEKKHSDRVCEEHVRILDGGMRLDSRPRATCDVHVPKCSCGESAAFWCSGPRCHRRVAWCTRHCRQHPNDAEVTYCPNCYEDVFPACVQPACALTATGFCEYVNPNGMSCGRRMCSKHIMRWQIYGPHKIGLGLCDQHRNIRPLRDDEVLYQVVAATAIRKLVDRRSRQYLPSLQSVHHILLKARDRAYGIPAINDLFTGLAARIGQKTELEQIMSEMLRRHADYRQENIKRDQSEKRLGLPIFEKLKTQLRYAGLTEIADQLIFSDYRPKANVIFVRLPQTLRGRMIGRSGSRIKELGQAIGAKIDFERGD